MSYFYTEGDKIKLFLDDKLMKERDWSVGMILKKLKKMNAGYLISK